MKLCREDMFVSSILCTILLISLTIHAESEPVLDTDGKSIEQGVEYYIVPEDGTRGGFDLAKLITSRCPANVAENVSPDAIGGGVPVTFAPLRTDETVIDLSTDFNIAFSTITNQICGLSTVWRVGGFESDTGKWYLTIGGSVGRPGMVTVSNWFKIEKHEDSYKFVFCPEVCEFCKVVCGDVGIVGGAENKRMMGLSDIPIPVQFRRKVEEPTNPESDEF